jgi:hypothetical protein
MLTKKNKFKHQNNPRPKQNPIKDHVYINIINNIICNDIIIYIHIYVTYI